MFIAIDNFGKRVPVQRAERGNSYYCPICKSQVIIKKGQERAAHFAHKCKASKGNQECPLANYAPMTDWHLEWQNTFPEENREIILEKDGKKHIADILIGNTVIEFQHSKMTIEEFRDRNDFFTSLGYKVLWVFDLVDLIKEDKIVQDPYYKNENQFNWGYPKKIFKRMNLENEKCQIYFQLSDGGEEALQRVAWSRKSFRVFITDKYHCFTLEEFVKKATTDPSGLFYFPPEKPKNELKTIEPHIGNNIAYSTIIDLWKEDTKWLIVRNNRTNVVYNLRYSPQINLNKHNMVFAHRQSGREYKNGELRYTFFDNEVPLQDWNQKVWSVVAETKKQVSAVKITENIIKEPLYSIRELMKKNPYATEIMVKNTENNKKFLLRFIKDNPYISSRRVYPALLDEKNEIVYEVDADKDWDYTPYQNQKVWIQIF